MCELKKLAIQDKKILTVRGILYRSLAITFCKAVFGTQIPPVCKKNMAGIT